MRQRLLSVTSLAVSFAILLVSVLDGVAPTTAKSQPANLVAVPDYTYVKATWHINQFSSPEVGSVSQWINRPTASNDTPTSSQLLSGQSAHNGNSLFVAITSDGEMYAFPTWGEPHQGYFIGMGDIGAVSDFDNDGFCEVLAVRESDSLMRLYESDGSTGFSETIVSDDVYPSADFALVRGRSESATGDFDNNGLVDFALTGRRCASEFCPSGGQGLVQVHLNLGNGHFERRSIDISGFGGRRWESMQGLDDGDFDEDGFLDLAAQQYWCSTSTNDTHLLRGGGNGTFVDSVVFSNVNYDGTPALVSGDFDNDGHLDLIVGQDDAGDPGQTWLYLGDGTGQFTYLGPAYDTNPAVESGDNRSGAGDADAYDFDADGNLDVIAAADGIGLLLFEGNGDGTFQSSILLNDNANLKIVATPPETQPPCKWAGGSGPDLWVDHVQVAQVLLTDTVPLIAEKLTLVRVYVGVGGADSISDITAHLYVEDSQGQVHMVDRTYYNYWPITAKATPDPYDLRDTVNFLPQVSWLTDTVKFWAEVDPENRVAETREDNNISEAITRTFETGQRLRIAWVPMLYAPPGPITSTIYPDERVASRGHFFVQRAFPVGINDVEYFRQPTHMVALMRQPFSFDNALKHYFPALDRFWDLTTRRNGWQGGQPPDRLFGWVPDEALSDICGIAAARFYEPPLSGRVAAGVAKDVCHPSPAEETFAHELGHILNEHGLRHAPNLGKASDPHCYSKPRDFDVDYPPYDASYPLGTIGVWGVDLYADALLSPANTYDFMTYCRTRWVSPYHYNELAQGFAPMTVQLTKVTSDLQPQLLVSGIVYTPALTVTFGTLYPITSTVPPDDNSGTDYCLELRSAIETSLDKRCFDLAFTNPETKEPMSATSFTLVLPYPNGSDSVVLSHRGAELGRVTASDNAPTVQLISPSGGGSWGTSGTYTVTWVADDLDGDPLSFIVSYSPDGGNAWMLQALDVTTPYLVLDSRNLPGSTTALIRVEASDQMHAAEDVSDAPLTVERKGPQAHILSPEGDLTVAPGAFLLLQGYGYDLEDGTLRESHLSWMSTRDGDLATGTLALVILSPGQHDVTLRVTDSDGNSDSASVSVYVGWKVFLPSVLRGR
jgi:hypothetical protein